MFAAREPAKPLNDAQMCGSFLFLWVYGYKNSLYVTMLTQMYSRLILDISSWLFAYRVSNAQIKVEVEGFLLVYRAERGAVVEVVAHARLDVDAHIA